ncbi:MAG: hypothetical protein KGY74_08655 [Candidatus Cloacimonetes bacterium]|nr:hypothetical protein [Candidatus Cloacimonadota bacterium]
MKKNILIFSVILLILFHVNLNAVSGELYISGISESEFVYKNSKDSLKSYFEEEFRFDVSYNDFRFGLEYVGNFPKYDKFKPLDKINSDDIKSDWSNRFVEYQAENFLARGGTFDAVFGTGLVLHAYDEEIMNEDNRLQGIYTRADFSDFSVKTLYGVASNQNYADKNDIVSGININFGPISDFTLSSSFLSERYYVSGPLYEYNEREVVSAAINLQKQTFDWKTEVAASKKYHTVSGNDVEGHAIYSNLNIYLKQLSFTGAYKNYADFDDRFSEPPTVNYSEEPLSETGDYSLVGKDEEGLMGIIRYLPNYNNEFVVNYSEGWSQDFKVRQSDLHTFYNRDFESFSLSLEFNHLEMKDENNQQWKKEVTPIASIDFLMGEHPILIKAEYEIKDKDFAGEKSTNYIPMLQIEIGIKDYSFSIFASTRYKKDEKIVDSSPRIGMELFAPIWSHTNVKFFLGEEKGGKICRNGVCNYQAPFSGARLTVTTRF